MQILEYDRRAAVEYAHRWAYGRNPDYLDFSALGGDCTSFASQCLLAGSGRVMNFTPVYGWYYRSAGDRAPAWTGVEALYRFLTTNQGAGPFGAEVTLRELEPGDLVQLWISGPRFHHTPVVVEVKNGGAAALSDVLVAAHSYDADFRPLSSYPARRMRFIHIEGVRTLPENPQS